MRFFASSIVGALLAGALFLGGCGGDPVAVRTKHMARAEDFAAKADWKAAIIEYRNALQADPKFAQGHYKLALAYLQTQQPKEAFRSISTAVQFDPANLDAQLKLGQFLLAAGQGEAAAEKAALVLAKEPERVEALLLHSGAFVKLQKLQEADKVLRKVLAIDKGNLNAALALARVLRYGEKADEAEQLLLRTAEARPEAPEPVLELALLYEGRGTFDKAETALKSALAKKPGAVEIAARLADFYVRRGNPQAAEAVYEQVLRENPAAIAPRLALAAFYRRQRAGDKALALLEQARTTAPEDLNVLNALAALYAETGKPQDADALVTRILEKDATNVEARLTRVRVLAGAQKLPEAAALVDAVIESAPRNGDAYYLKGIVCRAREEHEKAKSAFQSAVDYASANLNARLFLAEAYVRERSATLALEQLKFVLARDPENTQALTLAGNAHLLLGNRDEAAAAFEKARARAGDDPGILLALARIAIDKGAHDEAAAHLAKAVERNPDAVAPRLELARLHERRGDFAKAGEELAALLAAHPADTGLTARLAGFYLRRGDKEAARNVFVTAAQGTQSLGAKLNAAAFFVGQKDYAEAAKWLGEALPPAEREIEGLNSIAALYIQAQMPGQAAATVERATRLDAKNVRTRLMRAYLALADNKLKDAAGIIDAIIQEQPQNGEAFYYKGLLYNAERDRPKAKEALAKAVTFSPGNFKARLVLAEIALQERDADSALAQADQVLAKDDENYQAHVIKGNAQWLKRRTKEARAAYERAAQLAPGEPTAFFQLALLARAERRPDEAVDLLKKTLALKPDHGAAIATMVSLLAARPDEGEALVFLDGHIAAQASNAPLLAALEEMRGNLFAGRRRFADAAACFEKALAAAPDRLSVYFSLANLHLRQNETQQAIERYREVLKTKPDNVQALMAIGVIQETEGALAQAEATYAKAIEASPNFAPALNNLAWLLLQEGKDLERAFALAERAHKALPDDANVADTYGFALLTKGLFATAITTLQDAAQKIPENPAVWYHLAIAYWRYGKAAQAKTALQEALVRSVLPAWIGGR